MKTKVRGKRDDTRKKKNKTLNPERENRKNNTRKEIIF